MNERIFEFAVELLKTKSRDLEAITEGLDRELGTMIYETALEELYNKLNAIFETQSILESQGVDVNKLIYESLEEVIIEAKGASKAAGKLRKLVLPAVGGLAAGAAAAYAAHKTGLDDKIADYAGKAGNVISDKAHELKDKASQLADEAGEKLSHAIKAVKDKILGNDIERNKLIKVQLDNGEIIYKPASQVRPEDFLKR